MTIRQNVDLQCRYNGTVISLEDVITCFFLASEADTEIASLAHSWNCPVLSSDSDFFIFDIKAGYIPLTFFNWNSHRLSVRIFYRQKLASHFRIRAELIPLFASLAGNDYVSFDTLAAFNRALNRVQTPNHFGKRGARFANIANMLSELPDSSMQEVFKSALQMVNPVESRQQLRQAVEHSLQEYTLTEDRSIQRNYLLTYWYYTHTHTHTKNETAQKHCRFASIHDPHLYENILYSESHG